MQTLDLIIIFGYLIGVTIFGSWFGRKQETTEDYFVGDRSIPWWAIAAFDCGDENFDYYVYLRAGIAFAKGGNFVFLRFRLYIPGASSFPYYSGFYFSGELLTVYQLLGERFWIE